MALKLGFAVDETTFKNNAKERKQKMEFLRAILGDDLFSQVESKLNEHNGNEANKENQIKLGNLGTGEYVGKGKYDALQELIKGKDTELASANDLIAQLKKDTKGNDELQGKITAYEGQVADLQKELADTKMKSAIKVALLSANAKDVDYLTFKLNESLNEKGETLELDENDNIKGWDSRLETLKTTFPKMFDSGDGDNGDFKPLGDNKLPNPNSDKTVTKEQFNAMTYEERVKLKQDNEKLYKQLKN